MCYYLAKIMLRMCLLLAEACALCDWKMRTNTPKEFATAPQRYTQVALSDSKLLE